MPSVGTDSSNALALPPADNSRFVDLTGYCPKPPQNFSSVTQVVNNLHVGRDYELSFHIGTSSIFNNPNTVTVRVEILNVLARPFSSTVPATGARWGQFTTSFKSPGSSITVNFAGIAGGDYVGLDNVSLKQVCFLGGIFGGCE